MAYTTQNTPLPWVQPYIRDYLGRAQDVANQPYTQSPAQTAQPNALLNTGWNAVANRAMMGSPVMGAANQTLQDTLQGKYINANPYLDQNIANAQGDLVKQWNTVAKPSWETTALQSGSFGNTGVAEAAGNAQQGLANSLGRISTDMRSNAYNTERGFQQNALGYAPQFANQDYYDANQLLTAGTQQQGYQDRNAGQNYAWWQEAQKYPTDRLNTYGNAINGNYGSQTQQPGVSTASSTLGGALVGSQVGDNLGIGKDWGSLLGGLFGYFGETVMAITYDPNWLKSSGALYQGESGVDPRFIDQSAAFSGLDGLTSASDLGDGRFEFRRAGPDLQNKYLDQQAFGTVGPDGTVSLGDWTNNQMTSGSRDGFKLWLSGLAGMGALGAFGAAAGGAGSGIGAASGATHLTPALLESALGTAGYGASSASGLFGAAGAAGGAGLLGADPISAYLTTGATEGSTLGGLGGASGAVGSPGMAAYAPATNAALAESAVGTPGYGASSAGPGGGPGSLAGSGGLFADAMKKIGLPNVGATDLLKIGGLLGASAQKPDEYSGPMPTISRGGWSPSATAQYQPLMPTGTLPVKRGETNSGLWRYLGG